MKRIGLVILFSISCAEPPSSVNPGVAQPGAAEPGSPGPQAASGAEGSDDAAPTDAMTPPGGSDMGDPPGAIVASPGSDGPKERPEATYLQEALAEGVAISGTLACDECSGRLLVRIEDANARPPTLLTQKSFTGPGDYSIQAPKNMSVILMVVHDKNSDGFPTPGEPLGLWSGGLVDTSADAADVDLTVGVMPELPPVNLDPAPTE